eukprot:PhF_6_TR31135/c1_g1_i2/m.45594
MAQVEKSYTCCCCCPEDKDIKVDVDKLNRLVSEEEMAAPHVFVTLRSEPAGQAKITDDYGYISATYITRKAPRAGSIVKFMEREAEEVESARSHAVAKLRVKAASLGANAVMCLKIDVEQEDRLGVTTVIASGSAVAINPHPDVRNLPGSKPGGAYGIPATRPGMI